MHAAGLWAARQAGAQKPEAGLPWASAGQVTHMATLLAGGERVLMSGAGADGLGCWWLWLRGPQGCPGGFLAGEWAGASFRVRPRPMFC